MSESTLPPQKIPASRRAKGATGAAQERAGRLRIAKAGLKLREEAARALKEERPCSIRRAPAPAPTEVLPDIGEGLSPHERFSIIELRDDQGRTLVCLPPETALKQGFYPSRVSLALRTRRNSVFVRKRTDKRLGQNGTWDLYTDFIFTGEACEDTALRLLESAAMLGKIPVREVSGPLSWTKSDEPGSMPVAERYAFHKYVGEPLRLFIADVPSGLFPQEGAAELLEVDADELAGLASGIPELLSAELLWAQKSGLLFRDEVVEEALPPSLSSWRILPDA